MERRAGVVVSLQFLLPLALSWTRLAMNPSVFDVANGYAIRVTENWASRVRRCNGTSLTQLHRYIIQTAGMVSFCLAVGTCFISLALEIRTLLAYRAIASQRRLQLRDDYKLLGRCHSSPYRIRLLVNSVLVNSFPAIRYRKVPVPVPATLFLHFFSCSNVEFRG